MFVNSQKTKMEKLISTLQYLYPTIVLLFKGTFQTKYVIQKNFGKWKSSPEFLMKSSKQDMVFWGHRKKWNKIFSSASNHILDMYLPPLSSPKRLIRILYTRFLFIHLRWTLECFVKVAKGNLFISDTSVGLTKGIKD